MNDRSGRRYIPELVTKLHFLATDKAAREIHGWTTQKQLAAACGIEESTFKTLKTKGNKDRISPSQESGLAKACGFSLKWPQWATGTAEDFEQRYIQDAKPSKTETTKPRRTGIPLKPRDGEQETKDGRLVSLKMRVLSNSGMEWRVWIDLFCRAVDGYGIRRGYIALHCADAVAARDEANFHQPSSVNGQAVLRLASGKDRKPMWNVQARTRVLDDDVRPSEHFCVVREVADGDELRATFSVYVKDVPPQDPYISKPDGKPLAPSNRRLILDRIAALDLLDGKGDAGEVVLCSHKVSFDDLNAAPLETQTTDG